jgi:hypothetical protein
MPYIGFTAEGFLKSLDLGKFDGKITEVIQALTNEQLEKVADLMAKQIRETIVGNVPGIRPFWAM